MLPHELLVKIFYNLEQRPQHRHSSTSSISFSSSLSLDRTDILACALVCQDWYYAAVDTLWRDVDLQSVESFIQFGMAIDPTFAYMDASPRLCYYRQQQQRMDQCESVDQDGDDHNSGFMDYGQGQRRQGQLELPHRNSNNTAINIDRTRPVATATSSTPTRGTFSASTSSSSLTSLATSSSPTSSYSLSSLGCPSIPDQIGYAGKGYIRTFAIAGATDCQAPRPFPYLPSCITDRHLNAISPSLTHLTSISLSHCAALTDMAVIQLVTSCSPYLKRIDLTECRLITNLTVQVIARLCSQLEELSLQGCGLITDDAIEEVALHCTRLCSINIGQCQRVGDKSLEALLWASERMTQLGLASKVRTRNAQLRRLSVTGCRGITYSGLTAITEQLNAVGVAESSDLQQPQRSSLASLEFTCPAVKTPPIENVHGLSMSTSASLTASMRTLSQASRFFRTLPPTLEEISIHDAYTLSHSDIVNLVDQIGPGLKVLRFDHANAIDSETLGHLLAVCPNLTVLSIPRASRLDDSGLIQLIGAKCADSLVELDLSACHLLSDSCLTALAKCTSATSLTTHEKGKGVQESDPCLFPNLRRLDLSYNDKMTLGGIIPLVMSLKNLCALDVSFCGDGVTRSWSSTLESLRPILNPTSTSSALDSTDLDNLLDDTVIESDHSEDEESSSSNSQQHSPQEELHMQFSSHVVSSPTGILPPTANTQQYGLSSQNLQRFINNVAPLVSPSRLGLGRYVGPLLNRTGATTATTSNTITTFGNNDIIPQHPQQYPGQGGASLDRASPLGNRRRSSASSMTSSSSTSSMSSSSSSSSGSSSSSLTSDCSSSSSSASSSQGKSTSTGAHTSTTGPKRNNHHSRRRSSCSSRILLAERLDVLENTPRRSQHQRDMQDLQAALAVQQQAAAIAFQTPATATAGAASSNGALVGNTMMMPFAALSTEMMNHPIMAATRVGAATVGGINNGNGGGGGGPAANANGGGGVVHRGTHGTGGNDSNTNNHHNETFVYHGSRRLSTTASNDGPGTGPGTGAGQGGNRSG
ncbi:hypothetical protein EC991_009338, partial [Linnemannia zychae]